MTTRWSLVLQSGAESGEAKRALDELCAAYAHPLLVHARRSGMGEEEASDAVQGFLVQLLERGGLEGADPSRGRFRAYLLGAFAHFTRSEARAARTLKRGGGEAVVSLDAAALRSYDEAAYRDLSPEAAFDRAWAHEVIRAARMKLAREYESRGRGPIFAVLEDTLDGGAGGATYAERAAALDCSTGAAKVAAHRM
ncbi:MAG: hypothetical protein AAGG01_18195, partial [Planctomycetota bacterium]